MPSISTDTLYCTLADIKELLSVNGTIGRADDDNDGSISATEQTYFDRAINWATSRVNLYCLAKYAASELVTSALVNEWAVLCAAYWLSCRRGNPPPGSFDDLYKSAIDDLKLIHSGSFQIPDIGYRDSAWPAWSNIRVDQGYPLRKIRVERPISESSPVPYSQPRDRTAEYINDV